MDAVVGEDGKVGCLCSCGQRVRVRKSRALPSRGCGKCAINRIRERLWNEKFGSLLASPGQEILSVSQSIDWDCDCGRSKAIIVNSVLRGYTTTCGGCKEITLSTGDVIGAFTYFGPAATMKPGSSSLVSVVCACGTRFTASANKIRSGLKSCGKCGLRPAEWWSGRRFGSLTIVAPEEISIRSFQKKEFLCVCGQSKMIRVGHVAGGRTKTCGNCRAPVLGWFLKHAAELRTAVPRGENVMPEGGPVQLEPMRSSVIPFRALCPACLSEYKPRLSDIKRGLSLTCGCSSYTSSSLSLEMVQFVESLGLGAVLEHSLGGWKYDVFIPGRNLVIEMQGLHWHSNDLSKTRDAKKRQEALKSGLHHMAVFEDEWVKKRHVIESVLRSRLGVSSPSVSLRPSRCRVEPVSVARADALYEAHHYIGASRSKVNLGIVHDGNLIGCVSFGRPTRKSSHDWELTRMVMDPAFRVHGAWSSALKTFVSGYSPSSIVSFSDNRLFLGAVYERIGFMKDGDVPPDYYWVKGGRRMHKSGLRKPKGCTITETELRESEGYRRIWDFGKVRWVWKPSL